MVNEIALSAGISPLRPAPTWKQFCDWARDENEYQKSIASVHASDHPSPELRGRTYFEVNVFRYFHALQVCWPYLDRTRQKIMDVGSWPGVWLRAMAHFAAQYEPEVWASGLMFPDDFIAKMGGACRGTLKCELDVWSPMVEREAPNVFSEREFGFVSAMEVVEHLYHPGWMFKIIREAMVPGGILFMTTNNVSRLANLVAILNGGGLSGNLDELLPNNGGKLGPWRPHAREYTWRELDRVAQKASFELLQHGFYQENYALRLIEGDDEPCDELTFESAVERSLAETLKPLLAEPDQLKSGMYLLFRRA